MDKTDLEDKAAKVDLVATEALDSDSEEMEEEVAAVVVVAAVVAVDAARSNFVMKVINLLDTNALFILQNGFPYWSWQLYNKSLYLTLTSIDVPGILLCQLGPHLPMLLAPTSYKQIHSKLLKLP